MQLHNLNRGGQLSGDTAKKLLVILSIYFFMTIAARYFKEQHLKDSPVLNKLINGRTNITLTDAINHFRLDQSYIGVWSKTNPNLQSEYLREQTGKFNMRLTKISPLQNKLKIEIKLADGEYFDDGQVLLSMLMTQHNFQCLQRNNSVVLEAKDSQVSGSISKQIMLVTQKFNPISFSSFQINFTLIQQNTIASSIFMIILGTPITLQIQGLQPTLIDSIIFAIVLFIVSYFPFSSILVILKNIINGQDSSNNFSLVTVCLTSMWDTVLCVVAFVLAFNNQESVILFITPAFTLCLLFTQLQPKLMQMILQYRFGDRPLIFNAIHYGSSVLIYPILFLTNFNSVLFLVISSVIFPQIYQNAVRGVRPNLSNPYYKHYLLSRFLIILYLRGCPFNIFNFQPNYLLVFMCTLLYIFQYYLLYLQHQNGPKSVIPSFMLEPAYNYRFQQQINIQENAQMIECSICLNVLQNDPPDCPPLLNSDFRVMKTPCNHKYHSSCLQVWMKIKMECPQCRTKLPPFE